MSENPSDVPADPAPHRLDSWKEIASYLKRDVSTVQRWEKREGMPVHRHLHDKLGSVYAFPAELDAWRQSRYEIVEQATAAGQPSVEPIVATAPRQARHRFVWLIAALVAVVLAASAVWFFERANASGGNPLANARFVRLTDFEGREQAAAISRDGKFVAFLADRDGPVDVWVTQVGTGQFHNLTRGSFRELVNPDIRTIGFSPDATLVSLWVRRASVSHRANIDVWAVPTLGGEPKLYFEGAAELDWSHDGRRVVYHATTPGDAMFVNDQSRRAERQLFKSAAGLHNHFPVWSPDDSFIYFVHGVPDAMDIWRIGAAGGVAERLTSHNSRVTYPTFLNRRTLLYLATDANADGPWLYALDVERRKTRRVSFGVERYSSLAASVDGRRLVVTVANPKRTLWRVPITDEVAGESDATRVTVPTSGARSPRYGAGYLLYVSSETGGIWKLADGKATELWRTPESRVVGGPAIAPDGQHIAFSAEEQGQPRMYIVDADGSGARILGSSLESRGAPAWSPDGRSIAVGAAINGAPCLCRVSVDGASVPLVSGFAADPVWSPDGAFVVYSGPDIGTTFQLRTVSADGRIRSQPSISLSRGARRLVFLPGQRALVVLKGDMNHKNFFAVDLQSGRERQLTNFGRDFVIGDFDVSADGREIVFDRQQDNSDVVLIER